MVYKIPFCLHASVETVCKRLHACRGGATPQSLWDAQTLLSHFPCRSWGHVSTGEPRGCPHVDLGLRLPSRGPWAPSVDDKQRGEGSFPGEEAAAWGCQAMGRWCAASRWQSQQRPPQTRSEALAPAGRSLGFGSFSRPSCRWSELPSVLSTVPFWSHQPGAAGVQGLADRTHRAPHRAGGRPAGPFGHTTDPASPTVCSTELGAGSPSGIRHRGLGVLWPGTSNVPPSATVSHCLGPGILTPGVTCAGPSHCIL